MESARLLAIGLAADVVEPLVPGFAAAGAELVALVDARSALDLVGLVTPAAILARFPLPDLALERFCSRLRAPASPWREVPLLLLAERPELGEAARWVGRGATRAYALDVPAAAIAADVARLHVKAKRRPLAGVARLQVSVGERPTVLLCPIENISTTGVLVRSAHAFDLGVRCRFELPLPGDPEPLAGEAKVVRRASREREGLDGWGLRFLIFDGDGKRRLQRWLLQPRALREGADAQL